MFVCIFCCISDKFAALWPFIGICAEVIVLCVIIFLYERKQAKQLEKEVEKEELDFMCVLLSSSLIRDNTFYTNMHW